MELVTFAIFLFVGILGLSRAERIQLYARGYLSQHRTGAMIAALSNRITLHQQIISIKVTGGIAMAASGLLLFDLVRSLLGRK